MSLPISDDSAPRWVQDLDQRTLTRIFGPVTLIRGQEYARQGRVGQVTVSGNRETTVVQAPVRGSNYRVYQTMVTRAADGALTAVCTCPMRANCKHGAALLSHLRTADPSTSGPGWRRALRDLTGGVSDQGRGRALAVQVTRTAGAVELRPLMWGQQERWVRAGVSWEAVQHPWGNQFIETQRSALAGLFRTRDQRTGGSATRADGSLWLGEMGAAAWYWLRQAVAAGVELLPARNAAPVRLADEPARLLSRLSRADDGLQLRTVVAFGGSERALQLADLIGQPPHGFAVENAEELLLVPFAEPLGRAQQALLLQHSRLDVPEADIPAFTASMVTALRRLVTVQVDPEVSLPEVRPPVVLVRAAFTDDHRCDLAWGFRYSVGTGHVDVSLGDDESTEIARDDAAESALLAALPDGPWPVGEDGRPVASAALTGVDTARFAGDGLLLLRAHGVLVEVTGEPADYRKAHDAPQIRLAITEDDGSDWFNLEVGVTIDDEQVEYRELFLALALGQQYLILPSGTWFELDAPEFEQLRQLIAEAEELAPDDEGRLRLRTEHAGLWDELQSLGVVTEQSAAWRRAVAGLLSVDDLPVIPIPDSLRANLRPYQEVGFRWLRFLHDVRLGGILADDMGLGKTLQALALATSLKHDEELDEPMLVVAPTSVLGTWAGEAGRFAPTLDVRVVSETARKRNQPLAELVAGADLVVTSYTLLRLDEDDYTALPWTTVILDEAQFVKNRQARGYQSVRKLRARTKFAITGTPLENNLMDLWSLLSITAPGLFPDPSAFSERYRRPIEAGTDPAALARLHRRVRPLMLRRTKRSVAAELPPKQEQVLAIELDPAHRRLYDRQLAAERKKILGLVGDLSRHRIAILASLTRLRQLALSPALIDPHQPVMSAKLDALVELIGELSAEGHRALVFSQFTTYLGLVRDRLNAEGVSTSYLDGRTRDRAERIERFRSGDDPVFLISLKAGGFGLTLTEADYVFILDPWWNPAAELQAIDRTHRIGQDKHVMVYRLVSADTIEEKVVALQERKRDLFDQVVGHGGGDLAAPLTADDLRGLLEP